MTISETATTQDGLGNPVPLSHTQNFLRLFDQGDDGGPFGPRYNIVVGWRIRGKINVGVLQQAIDDVVARHDSLRAEIVRGDGTGYQTIHPPRPATLLVRDVPETDPASRDLVAEQLLTDIEAGSYDSKEIPHLRVILDRFDDHDAVFALIVHHTAGDGWSMNLLMRDIATCYALRRGYPVAPLPEARPYQEYAEWQQANASGPTVDAAKEYWRDKLADTQMSAVRTDHRRSEGLEKKSPVYRFSISAELTARTLELAKAMRSSPFMVLHAAYNVLLSKRTGETDLVIPTLTSGRTQPEYQETVGPFFNFVPLRTVLTGCRTFREVVERTRATCIEALMYDTPFAQVLEVAPQIMAPLIEDDRAAIAFQVWQFSTVLDHTLVGDLEYTEVRSRVLSQYDGTDIPDGALLTLDIDPSGEIFGNLAYNSNLYDESSMVALVADYQQVLRNAVAAPDGPLTDV